MTTAEPVYIESEIEEERRKARKAAKLRYAKKPWTCDTCKVTVNRSHKWDHERTKKHDDNASSETKH